MTPRVQMICWIQIQVNFSQGKIWQAITYLTKEPLDPHLKTIPLWNQESFLSMLTLIILLDYDGNFHWSSHVTR